MEIRRYKLGEEDAIWRVHVDATHESIQKTLRAEPSIAILKPALRQV